MPTAPLRLCRAFYRELGKVQADVTIQGPVYQAISAINGKMDGLAEQLTGEQAISAEVMRAAAQRSLRSLRNGSGGRG